MNELISICIPTYERPQFLVEAIKSCFEQKYRPLELLIGDDSRTDDSEVAVKSLAVPAGVELKYFRHTPSLGQAANINRLMQSARGARLCVLHDDDILESNAIEHLAACWDLEPGLGAAYGKQYIMSESGEIDVAGSDQLNSFYRRTSEQKGRQDVPVIAGLLQQFPNDGYLVTSELARKVGFLGRDEVGDGCDFDFGIRLGLACESFYFLDEYTCRYRLTSNAVSRRQPQLAAYMFPSIEKHQVPAPAIQTKRQALEGLAAGAIKENILRRNRGEAWRVYFSTYFPMQKRLHPRGLYLGAGILVPALVRR